MSQLRKPVRTTTLREMKRQGKKITMLTAYDATMARIFDDAGVDVLLVGDSLGMVIMGCDSTIPVTLDVMVHHARSVSRGVSRALIVADLPFLTFQVSTEEALRNAGRLIQEGHAAAVKLEGSAAPAIERMVNAGIPVMGHLGLTPQSVHQLGGYVKQGKTQAEAEKLRAEARQVEESGAFALVLEAIPNELAAEITRDLSIPTIGIGAGPCCDGQVLVSYDAFGLYRGHIPSFVRQYAKLGEELEAAAVQYIDDVRNARFPAADDK